MESRFIMAILPQELSEVCENPSQIYNIPSETGAMLRDASLLVRKIAALDAVIGGASVRGCDHFVPWRRVRWRRLSAVM